MSRHKQDKREVSWFGEETVNLIVDWWVAQISAPLELRAVDGKRCGAPWVETVAIVGMTEEPEEKIERFRTVLAALVREERDKQHDKGMRPGDDIGPSMMLICEYQPVGMLAEAAKQAGINTLNFPFKTYMWVADGVYVKVGYGAYRERISL
jgi:hypothetical protein